MTDQQDAGPVAAPGRAGADMVAVAVAAGNALDRGAERGKVAGDLGHQHVDRLAVGAWRFDLDPGPYAVEDLLRVDLGQVGAACGHAWSLRLCWEYGATAL